MSEVSRKSRYIVVSINHAGMETQVMTYPDIPGNKKIAKQTVKLRNRSPHANYKLRCVTEIVEEF